MSVTSRGFALYADFTDRYGGSVRVQESSLATEPCVWIFTKRGASHLTVEQARTVRDALTNWLNEHTADRPSVTDNARADLHPVVTEHQIIGTQTGQQGAGQVVPEDSVLCIKCGWMRCSDYTWHLSDALAAGRAETTTATDEDAARLLQRYAARESVVIFDGAAQEIAQALAAAGLLATARTRPTPTRDKIIQALDLEGAFCGTCGREPGDPLEDCDDCRHCLNRYADALADAGLLARPTPTREHIARAIAARHWDRDSGEVEPWDQLTAQEQASVIENYAADDAADAVLALLEGGTR